MRDWAWSLGELAGLPEGDEVFEAGEEADEAGVDEGVQHGEHAVIRGIGAEVGDDGGELPVQWLWRLN